MSVGNAHFNRQRSQDGQRLVCGVHYRPCDGSTGGEQCAIHIMLHTEGHVMLVNERKVALCFMLGLQKFSGLRQQQDVQVYF